MEKKAKRQRSRPLRLGETRDIHTFVLLALLDEPLSKEQILKKYDSFRMHFGPRQMRMKETTIDPSLIANEVQRLVEGGLVEEAETVYRLTTEGRAEALKAQEKVTRAHTYLTSGTTVSKVSITADIFLAVLKLTAGFLSNSAGLISDGFDSTTDIFSSATVYLGSKYRKEFFANLVVLALLFVAGISLAYNGITRLIWPQPIRVGLLPALAAVVDGIVCYMLFVYQRFVGKQTGNFSLVSQSIDSNNHVYYAIAVLIGLAFGAIGLPFVDSLVGLGVAALILKSAAEISIETFKSAKGEEMDFSRFKAGWEKRIDEYRRNYFKFWTLMKLEKPMSTEELTAEFEKVFSETNISQSLHVPVTGSSGLEEFKGLLKELTDQGLISEKEGKYQITEHGKEELMERLKNERYRQ